MIAYTYGVYDILRAKDLQELDRQIQLSKQGGAKYFALGIYENNLCENLGFNTPLKSLEDRMNIMQQIRGVDFVFPVSTLQTDILKDSIKNSFKDYSNQKNESNSANKKYELGYAHGTYDLFHAGHLENLTIASSNCEKLVVGVKSDELVQKHKNRKPIISAEERMEILRHFKFVYDVYTYYTRDLSVASEWFQSKYRKTADAIFFGSDLENDFANSEGFNIVYTPRDKKTMKTRSTTAYRKLHLSRAEQGTFKGHISNELLHSTKTFNEKTPDDDNVEQSL